MVLATGLLWVSLKAVPADPTPIQVTQPDGSTLTIKLHGDEFFHFTSTVDGYTVVKNMAGYYTYARLDGDRLVASDRIARNADQRTVADRAALAGIPKGLTSRSMVQSGTRMLNRRNSAMRRVGSDGMMDYDNFKGLIILINYTDKKFTMPDANAFYDDMVNTHDYTGYTLRNRVVRMTGSVRDYYYDNSNQQFDPHFDVVGPVNVPYKCTDQQSTNNSAEIFDSALAAVDDDINFADYDTDGDGFVDMVFFLVAGLSANYGGNNEAYLWPHMYYLYYATPRDGVRFGLYACSTEIAGWEGYYSDVNGIGTFCHEFGHVLGLPDLYDTDYTDSGGESLNPGQWSIMSGGSGNNFGRNPVGYSLYERYALGFTTPTLLQEDGEYLMSALDVSNGGYRLNTPNENEFFLIENRQMGKWDRFLPGHGMMVARVDSTDERVWWQNTVNCDPKHMYYELLRSHYNGQDSDHDPFPGADGVTSITNFTNPGLLTWDRSFNDYAIYHITEHDGGIISFTLERDTSILEIVEDFEVMPATSNMSAKQVQGVFTCWNFSKSAVTDAAPADQCNGHKAVAMKKPSMISTSEPLNIIPYAVRFTIFNPSNSKANFKFTYSVDSGKTWLDPNRGIVTIEAKSVQTNTVNLPTSALIMFRINQTSGSDKVNCYLDDIKLYYKETWAPEFVTGDVNGDGEVNIADINEVLDIILSNDFTGRSFMARADVNDDGEINVADINMIINLIVE